MDAPELLWRQYSQNVGLFKFYMDLVVKFNVFYYAVTGAILSFFFANPDTEDAKYALPSTSGGPPLQRGASMEISATVKNSQATRDVLVRTGAATQVLAIRPKADGRGSAVNGGELLMLALATCFCNDLYREAERLRIPIDGVELAGWEKPCT